VANETEKSEHENDETEAEIEIGEFAGKGLTGFPDDIQVQDVTPVEHKTVVDDQRQFNPAEKQRQSGN